MRSEWRECTLGDALTLKRGFDLPARERKPGNIPIISSAGISDYHSEAKIKGPGVVTGRYGTIGNVFFCEKDFWPLNTTLFVEDFKNNNARFVYYFLQTIDYQKYSDKAAVPGVNRNHLHTAKVVVPDITTQQEIASILSAIDDKIALNRQTNATLEAIAQALFKSWFVDFDPVRAKMEGREPEGMDEATAALFPSELVESELGLIPKGWAVKNLDQVADYLNGLALQKFPPESDDYYLPVIKIAQLRQGHTTGADKASRNIKQQYIIRDGDVLFSWSGSLEVEIWCGGEGALNQHLFKVTSEYFPRWLYFLWTRYHLATFREIAANKATTMGHIQRHHLTQAKTVIPPNDLLAVLSEVLDPLIADIVARNLESRSLAEIRESLLPKLISGQIRIPEELLGDGHAD